MSWNLLVLTFVTLLFETRKCRTKIVSEIKLRNTRSYVDWGFNCYYVYQNVYNFTGVMLKTGLFQAIVTLTGCTLQLHFLPYIKTNCTPCKNASSTSLQLGLKQLDPNFNLDIAQKSVISAKFASLRSKKAIPMRNGKGRVVLLSLFASSLLSLTAARYLCENVRLISTTTCRLIKLVDNLLTLHSFRLYIPRIYNFRKTNEPCEFGWISNLLTKFTELKYIFRRNWYFNCFGTSRSVCRKWTIFKC